MRITFLIRAIPCLTNKLAYNNKKPIYADERTGSILNKLSSDDRPTIGAIKFSAVFFPAQRFLNAYFAKFERP
jgi:hypothetical protein